MNEQEQETGMAAKERGAAKPQSKEFNHVLLCQGYGGQGFHGFHGYGILHQCQPTEKNFHRSKRRQRRGILPLFPSVQKEIRVIRAIRGEISADKAIWNRRERREQRGKCSIAMTRDPAVSTRFLPQRNAKNAEIRGYGYFSLRSLRSFAANSSWAAAGCGGCFRGQFKGQIYE